MANLRDNKTKSIPAGNHMPRSNDPCRNAFYFMSDSDNNIRRFLSLRKNQRKTDEKHLFHTGKVDLMFDQILIDPE